MKVRVLLACALAGIAFFSASGQGLLPDGWVKLPPRSFPKGRPPFLDEAIATFDEYANVPRRNLKAAKMLRSAGGEEILRPRLPVQDNERIRELARGLDYDILKCYNFVRNHIAYTP